MKKIYKSFKTSPKYSIKWSNYFNIYENLLSRFINKKIIFVEIGIGDGGSLFMWRKFLGKKAKIIGIELNPDAKKLEKYGFKIFIGDQSDPEFWKNFYKKIGRIDVLIDDGGHTNIQQITTLMESIKFIKNNGIIAIEDTHTSFMRKKGFGNPSKYSFISCASKIIENLHRRNPNLNKSLNIFSKKVSSIEFFDSITVFKINENDCLKSKNLENNIRLRKYFDDYRYKKNNNKKNKNLLFKFLEKNFSKRTLAYKTMEKYIINKYLRSIK